MRYLLMLVIAIFCSVFTLNAEGFWSMSLYAVFISLIWYDLIYCKDEA